MLADYLSMYLRRVEIDVLRGAFPLEHVTFLGGFHSPSTVTLNSCRPVGFQLGSRRFGTSRVDGSPVYELVSKAWSVQFGTTGPLRVHSHAADNQRSFGRTSPTGQSSPPRCLLFLAVLSAVPWGHCHVPRV